MKVLCLLSQYAYGKPERGENYDYINFVPAWRRLGHDVRVFDSGRRYLGQSFVDLNEAFLGVVVDYKPDVIFCVLMNYEIWIETLDLIRTKSPVLVINWGTDDSWKFRQVSKFLAGHVDIHVTTDADSERGARRAGISNVVLSQWAASSAALSDPISFAECDYDVSFIGTMYGYRSAWISELRRAGVTVSAFGHGTENGVVAAEQIPLIFQNSRISLNFSGAGQAAIGTGHHGRQIKARTFEVPGAGGFLLTEAAPGLEQYYKNGEEIVVFETARDLIEKVSYFLNSPAERDKIACAGQIRTSNDHVYETRFASLIPLAQSAGRRRTSGEWTLERGDLKKAMKRHSNSFLLRFLRSLLVLPLTAVYGSVRGPRAARRLIYEVSWRLVGERTYRAGGWVGRMFYNES